LGFPALGLAGSAWAGIVSGLVRLAVMLYVFIGQEDLLLIRNPRWKELPQSFRSVLYIAFPSMLSSLISPVSLGVIIWLLAGHGPQVVAGFGVASRIDTLATMVLMSLSASVAPFIGQNWGARNVSRIYAGLSFSYRISLVWGLICVVILAPFGDDLIRAINANPVVVASAAMYLLIVPISYGAMGVGMMSGSCFIALGKPIPNLVMSLTRMAVVYIPLAMLGNSLFGSPGVYGATCLANVIMGTVAWRWNRSVLAREVARLRGGVA
jgi:Na+-driven multidrug efflux pump